MGRMNPGEAVMAGQGGCECHIYVHFRSNLKGCPEGGTRSGRGAGLWYLLAL